MSENYVDHKDHSLSLTMHGISEFYFVRNDGTLRQIDTEGGTQSLRCDTCEERLVGWECDGERITASLEDW